MDESRSTGKVYGCMVCHGKLTGLDEVKRLRVATFGVAPSSRNNGTERGERNEEREGRRALISSPASSHG